MYISIYHNYKLINYYMIEIIYYKYKFILYWVPHNVVQLKF